MSNDNVNRNTLFWYRFGLAACCLALTACGWRLRGDAQLPPAIMPVRIEAVDEYSDFFREFRRALLAAGATLADEGERAGAVVRIRGDASGENVLSVSSRNTPEEYLVYYNIEYGVQFDGREAIALQPLGLTATYSYDPQAVLAKERERRGIQEALARELAVQVLRRLSSLKAE